MCYLFIFIPQLSLQCSVAHMSQSNDAFHMSLIKKMLIGQTWLQHKLIWNYNGRHILCSHNCPSFIHSLVRSFSSSLVHPSDRSFVSPSVRSFIHCFHHSFIRFRSFIYSSIHLFINFVHLCIYLFYLFIYKLSKYLSTYLTVFSSLQIFLHVFVCFPSCFLYVMFIYLFHSCNYSHNLGPSYSIGLTLFHRQSLWCVSLVSWDVI